MEAISQCLRQVRPKEVDEVFDIPRFYISACSYSVQYVRLHPILISILLYNYKQLAECISEVEQIEAGVKNNYYSSSQKKKGLTMKEEEEDLPPPSP
jgi:hypothetical protein